ncbi:hypothetical protein [Acinetobacter junii]|uniref:hypothetical protein n=1 Tax=Acinetobacter junii TaxID=40215 RepID=UPI00124D22F9|nr:hypothetical protein [Acinetobacter junii]
MTNLTPKNEWSDVYQLEKTDQAIAGPNGIMNAQAQSLLNRTEYLQSEKASNEDLENVKLQISTAKSGVKFFKTLAQLQAYYPSETDPQQAYVFATQKYYLWDNGSWDDEGVSVLQQSTDYTDDLVRDLFKRGVNIYDPKGGFPSKYWNAENGQLNDALDKFIASKLIVVTPGVEYQVPNFYNQQIVYLDEYKIFISGEKSLIAKDFKFTPPVNTKFVGLTLEHDWVSTFMLCESAKYPPLTSYVPFTLYKEEFRAKPKQIIGLEQSIKDSMSVEVQNIIDTSNVILGKYIEWNTGRELEQPASEAYCIAGFYSVKPNTEYQTSSFYDQQFCFYNDKFEYLSGQVTAVGKKFTTPANTAYIRFSVKVADLASLVVTESANFQANTYVPYAMEIPKLKVKVNQVDGLEDKVKEVAHIVDLNIVNLATAQKDKYVNFENGQVGSVTGHYATDYLPIKSNTIYRSDNTYNQQFAFYTKDKVYISGLAIVPANKKFTTPANAEYARFTVPVGQLGTILIAEDALFPSEYTSFEVKTLENIVLPDPSAVLETEIFTSADANEATAQFKGKNAVQLALDSIADATDKKRYVIKTKGFHKVDVASEVIGYPGYPSMILAKNHVDIIGDGKTMFWCELPFNDADIGPSANGTTYSRTTYQTLYSYAKDCLIKDVTFVIVNGRYALHLDNPNGANSTHRFENVLFVSKGSKGSMQALGCGTSTGEETYFIGGGAHSDGGTPFYCHNNSKFSTPSKMYFEGFKFSSNTSKLIVRCENDGSLVDDKMQMVGCSWGGTSYVMEYGQLWLKSNTSQDYDSFNHAEWKFSGYGNDPFLFDNQVAGYCLRIKTTATGLNNTIRFDKSSSAYSLLIQNNQANTDVSLYTNSRDYIDGYIIQDGSVGLSAQAWGCKDLTETASYADSNVVYTSLGKRLGDCSTSNKTLGVIINGTTNNVVFNKNYSSMTNAQIVAEINTQLSSATADLYSYGRDYYAEMTDVVEIAYNTSSAYIPKGSIVAKSSGSVRLASAVDKVFGVALDDIPVQTTTSEGLKKGEGRVLKCGYIYTNQSKAHFVLADNQNPNVGIRFAVNNGQLVTDANGKISCDIDTGVISINC